VVDSSLPADRATESHNDWTTTKGSPHAHRVAYAALKHSFEKVGDHWEEKETRGPSDERARSGGPNARGKTAEGVDTSATKDHLLSIARRLEIRGRSSMNKEELVAAIEKANRRESRKD
ncbi:ChaB family protein, partial [Mycobacteroides abscessus]|uniref:ChaB family protein n=1 Tax=Mycobacteroides abscessus TaxID=36809 RepID=UPI001F347B52